MLHRFVAWGDVAAIAPRADALALVVLVDGDSVTVDAGHAVDAVDRSRKLAQLRSLATEHGGGQS